MRSIFYLSVMSCLFLVGCSKAELKKVQTKSSKVSVPVALSPPAFQIGPVEGKNNLPIDLKMVSVKNRVEIASNCHVSIIKSYEGGELRAKKIQSVEFKVKTTTRDISKNIEQEIETFFKDGSMDLHDLAYPELGEKIIFTFDSAGRVLKAGDYSSKSLFFVPPLPLPTKKVKVGDMWDVESTWVTEGRGVSMTLYSKMSAKFTSWRTCGKSKCVEVYVTGSVRLPPQMENKEMFDHKITGLFLMDPRSGLVPWSKFVSDERVKDGEDLLVVRSTLLSVLIQPPGFHKASHEEQACPSEKMEE